MMRWLRRLFWLGLLAAAGYGSYRAWSARQSPTANAPQWSPAPAHRPRTDSTLENPTKTSTATATEAAPPAQRWVAPAEGGCPDGYPVKANDSSGIFHVPGGRFYTRSGADRCYANPDDAVADGYRAAKA